MLGVILKFIFCLIGLIFVELGILSFMVAMAYWPFKGAGVAGLVGVLMAIAGAMALTKGYRLIIGDPKKKRDRAFYY